MQAIIFTLLILVDTRAEFIANSCCEFQFEVLLNVVHKCHMNGVNDVYVSGITVRPRYQKERKKINEILRNNATDHRCVFICNNNIEELHLSRDNLHLNNKGIILLANNFLKAVNKCSIHSELC